jgi:hypothetical protein
MEAILKNQVTGLLNRKPCDKLQSFLKVEGSENQGDILTLVKDNFVAIREIVTSVGLNIESPGYQDIINLSQQIQSLSPRRQTMLAIRAIRAGINDFDIDDCRDCN